MKLIFRGNETRILGALSDVRRQDCLLRGKSTKREKVALNFCGGIVSIRNISIQIHNAIIVFLNTQNRSKLHVPCSYT